jgi:hypothetical protein
MPAFRIFDPPAGLSVHAAALGIASAARQPLAGQTIARGGVRPKPMFCSICSIVRGDRAYPMK